MAAHCFEHGVRVVMTEKAIRQRLNGPKDQRRGFVSGKSGNPKLLRVHRDGRKRAETYHMDFWAPEENGKA